MMRRQRKATPLIALLSFEIAAIVGLHFLGSADSMQVQWGDFSNWIQGSTIEEIAAPFIRLFALVVAYWMFASTALFALAQASRIPAAIRATSMLTLPSVRRVVDGAVAVSIATTSLVGIGGTAAMASTNPAITLAANDDLSVVDSPTPANAAQAQGGTEVNKPADATTTTSGAPTTTSSTTSSTSTTSTTAAPAATPSPGQPAANQANQNTPVAPSGGDNFVSSPRPGGPASAPAPTTTTTEVPRGPSTPAPATPQSPAEVLGAQEHKVAAGDNLWTISRDALASSTNRSPKDVSESEVRDYWLKVIDENRTKLRSGDPHWIFPGEVISLPTAS